MSLFPYRRYKATKPCRLIELFAGIGSQAKALENLGAPHEKWFVCEYDKFAIKSYNAIHSTNFEPLDIRNVHGKDLRIEETDKYTYLLTYSFPCTSLSIAGRMDGMEEGSGTQSSLLFEVKRILCECDELPELLLLENVPQLLSPKNEKPWREWLEFLQNLGYSNHVFVMNAMDYGIPQSRERVFMVSIKGEYDFDIPSPFLLKHYLCDYVEEDVDDKYIIYTDKAHELIDRLVGGGYITT